MEIEFYPTVKQDLVFELFDDKTTTEVLYGGSAGAGKSYLICALIILKSLEFPGIRIGLARNELTNLKKTTIVSFFEVANNWGLTEKHFSYNSTAGIIKFYNGSEVVLLELAYKPSDPSYTRLGGHLLTFGVVDEVGEVDEKGYSIFKTRLGRWKNDELGVKPICISTCNPIKNWLYRVFYEPFKEDKLEGYKKFVQALPTDNHNLPISYIENLEKLPYADRERLLYGNWDYDDDEGALLSFREILDIFTKKENPLPEKKQTTNYITADIAFTSDKCVILVWEDYFIKDIIVNPPQTDNLEDYINKLAIEHKVNPSNIAYDSDGVGKFLTTRLRGSKPIVNNATPLNKENYKNLKTQLYFKLVDKIKEGLVKITPTPHEKEIIEELSAIIHKVSDKVGKLEIMDKGDVKRRIGRSPDFSDAMAYRMYFEYKNTVAPARRVKFI
ncbi:MAG: terminase [archaeon]|nr:terminase [archaeon]